MPEPEWAFWMDDGNMSRFDGVVHKYFLNARRVFSDIAGEVRRFKPGAEVAPGIVSVPAYGHTPGHTAFAVHSGNQSLLAMSDTVREPWLFVRHPEWQPGYDMDGPLAVKARPICSTARPPTACWSRPITSRSRPAVTSSRAARASTSRR